MESEKIKVFISYAREDSGAAHRLYNDLRAAGLDPWLDKESIRPGEDWRRAIQRGVRESRFFLALLSSTSVAKRGTIQKEFKLALDTLDEFPEGEIFVIPLRLDECEPTHERLCNLQWADMFPDWQEGLRRILWTILGDDQRDDGYEGTKPVPVGDLLDATPESPFFVPFPRNTDFVGRDEDLATLYEMITQGGSPVGIRPTVLVGLGGIGKTQLAVEYAHAHRDDYPGGVFWLNAVNPLLYEFADLAETLDLADKDTPHDQAARQAWAYLDGHPDALVIFDNVVEPANLNVPFTSGLIPANLRCRTLFTTRQRDFPRNFQPFEVKVLPEAAAMRLLLRARPEVLEKHHPEWGVARIVCASLGWLPLALELAAAYLGEYSEVTLEGYLERLRAEGKLMTVDDTGLRPEDLPTRHEAAVAATLRTQWSRLDKEEDKDARLLFRAAGQLPEATWIPTARLGLLTGIEAEAGPGRPAPLTPALKKLYAVSLIEELTDDRLRLHPLVREFAAGLSSASFRAQMAVRGTTTLSDPLSLETQVIRRGVDAVLEDLRTGLWLCADSAKAESIRAQLSGLERVLDRETHNLRGWDPTVHPVCFIQQVYMQAADLGLKELQDKAEALLSSRRVPYLVLRWHIKRESSALERTLSGHSEGVRAVAVTTDGYYAVSASKDCTLKVWDLQTGRCKVTLTGHSNEVRAVALTPDGRRAVSASKDLTLRVWDLHTGQEERVLRGHSKWIFDVALTPDGRFAVSASFDCTLKAWNLQTGQEKYSLTGHSDKVYAVAVASDGSHAVSASKDCTLKVWDLQTGQEVRTLSGHTDCVLSVTMTPDGRRVISGSDDQTVRVWDIETGREEYVLRGHNKGVLALAVTPDGLRAISGSKDLTLKIWNLQMGQEERTFTGHSDWVYSVAVTPCGRWVISGSFDCTLKVWDLQMDQGKRLAGHRSRVYDVAVTSDGDHVLSASQDHTLKMWNLKTGQEERTFAGHSDTVYAVAVMPNRHQAVSASQDCMLKVWDLQTCQEKYTFSGHSDKIRDVEITPEGRWVISGSFDCTLKVWDLQEGQEKRTLTGHSKGIRAVAVMPNGRQAISGSRDLTLKVWDLETGREECTLAGHNGGVCAVVVTPDGRRAISGSFDRTLKVWNLQTGQEEHTLTGHKNWVNGVAVMQDGHLAVSVSKDRTVKIWDLETGQEIASVALGNGLWCVAVAQDGTTIVVGDTTGNVYCLRYVG